MPVSGVGSNTNKPAGERRVPVLVITGGAFTTEKFDTVRETDMQKVPWVRMDIENVPRSK